MFQMILYKKIKKYLFIGHNTLRYTKPSQIEQEQEFFLNSNVGASRSSHVSRSVCRSLENFDKSFTLVQFLLH